MKTTLAYLALLVFAASLQAESVVPNKVDLKQSEKREAAFSPWNSQAEAQALFSEKSRNHIPIYNECRENNVNRDIYLLNEKGIPYWVLGGLSEKSLLKTHKDKLKIGDELVSVSCYTDERGTKSYWALWCPASKSYWVKDRLRELGIEPPHIEYSYMDQLEAFSNRLAPYTAVMVMFGLLLNITAFMSIGFLVCKNSQSSKSS